VSPGPLVTLGVVVSEDGAALKGSGSTLSRRRHVPGGRFCVGFHGFGVPSATPLEMRHRPCSPNQYPRPPAVWRTVRRWWQSGLG
jgi:hypothetical protein